MKNLQQIIHAIKTSVYNAVVNNKSINLKHFNYNCV